MIWTPLRLTLFAFSVCAPFLLAPSIIRAQDPVKDLENALRIDLQKLADPVEQRDQVKAIVQEPKRLKTLPELRAAYFLKEWQTHIRINKNTKLPFDKEMFAFHELVGKDLEKVVIGIAEKATPEQKMALALVIAEIAEQDPTEDRRKTGKYASVFTELLIGTAKTPGFVDHADPRVRQAGWHALGKITPSPNDHLRGKLRAALAAPEVGVRRVAAYALTDIVKNAHFFEDRDDEQKTMELTVETATHGLRPTDSAPDEWVRGYCLQAIAQTGRTLSNYSKPLEFAYMDVLKEDDVEKWVVHPRTAKLFDALDKANSGIAAALKSHGGANSVKLRLTALDTLSKVVIARSSVLDRLYEIEVKLAPGRVSRAELFQKHKSTDPLAYFLAIDVEMQKLTGSTRWNWEVLGTLLDRHNDVRLRRGAVLFLETVAEDIEAAHADEKLDKSITPEMRQRLVHTIARGLVDSDYLVRWTAARSMRQVAIQFVDAEIVRNLGRVVIDRDSGSVVKVDAGNEGDPSLSATAVSTLRAIASSEHAWHSVEFLKSALIDRRMDVETREAALQTLIQIGQAAQKQKDKAKKQMVESAVSSAFPQVIGILADRNEDLRLRRAASQALGRMGQPATSSVAEELLAVLTASLRDEDAQIRQQASEAMLSIRVP